MKRTRKKHNAVIKSDGVVVAAVGGTGRSPSWRVSSAFIRRDLQLEEAAAGRGGERFRRRRWRTRMLGKRSLEKRCPSDGGPRVRIHLPPADSLSLFRSRFRRSRTRLSSRVCADRWSTA